MKKAYDASLKEVSREQTEEEEIARILEMSKH
jgi:hypothetical protein